MQHKKQTEQAPPSLTPFSSSGILHSRLPLHTLPNPDTTPSTTKVPRLPLQERADGAEVALVTQKVGLLGALGPEFDGVREGVDGLSVTTDEAAAKINVLEVVFFGLEVCDLADVVAAEKT